MVADETELKGAWDFDFKFTPKGMKRARMAACRGITLFDAMDKLGLKLEPARSSPMPVIVVDSVNEKPSGNPPNVAEILHITPPPTEFDVADTRRRRISKGMQDPAPARRSSEHCG